MPAKLLIVQKSVRKKFTKLPLNVHKRIITALTLIQKDPISGIKLHGGLADYYKFRVGDYRIVYKFDSEKSVVIVVKVEHRQGVYK